MYEKECTKMNSNSSVASKSTIAESDNNVKAKLKRLKIQEDLLFQNIKNIGNEQIFLKSCISFKNFQTNLINSYHDIKNLFEDVKSATKSEENLKSIDITDVKKDVLELDEKIKYFKARLQKEHLNMKQEEQKLTSEINSNAVQNTKSILRKKVTSKTFSDIVLSPVKTLINSPSKCQEIQEFQDFIHNTNKFGRWSEYNHNIFTKIWEKYFNGHQDFTNYNFEENHTFIGEVLHSVAGVKKPDIVSHMKWYARYLHLKERQRNALEKWKIKNRALKAPHCMDVVKDYKRHNTQTSKSRRSSAKSHTTEVTDENTLKSEANINDYAMGSALLKEKQLVDNINASEFLNEVKVLTENTVDTNDDAHATNRYAKPTKQWENKCKAKKEINFQDINNIDDIGKLGTPHWRKDLLTSV